MPSKLGTRHASPKLHHKTDLTLLMRPFPPVRYLWCRCSNANILLQEGGFPKYFLSLFISLSYSFYARWHARLTHPSDEVVVIASSMRNDSSAACLIHILFISCDESERYISPGTLRVLCHRPKRNKSWSYTLHSYDNILDYSNRTRAAVLYFTSSTLPELFPCTGLSTVCTQTGFASFTL